MVSMSIAEHASKNAIGIKIGLLLFSLCFVCLVGEVMLRVLGFPTRQHHLVLHADMLLKGKPNASFLQTAENRNLVMLNNWGFHDYDREEDNGFHRVLFLGDSFLEARQVPTDSIFTSIAEQKFRQADYPVEILNGGYSGVGTPYQYLLWKTFFQPNVRVDELVLVMYMGNDLENNNLSLHTKLLGEPRFGPFVDADGEIFRMPLPQLSKGAEIANYLSDYSALMQLVSSRLSIFSESLRRENVQQNLSTIGMEGVNAQPEMDAEDLPMDLDWDAEWRSTVHGTLNLIQRWQQELRTENITLSIVVLEKAEKKFYDEAYKDAFLQELRTYCGSENVQLLQLDFSGYSRYQTHSFDNVTIGHFNPFGHRVAADQIFDWMTAFPTVQQTIQQRHAEERSGTMMEAVEGG